MRARENVCQVIGTIVLNVESHTPHSQVNAFKREVKLSNGPVSGLDHRFAHNLLPIASGVRGREAPGFRLPSERDGVCRGDVQCPVIEHEGGTGNSKGNQEPGLLEQDWGSFREGLPEEFQKSYAF